jgi:hypothetical protein
MPPRAGYLYVRHHRETSMADRHVEAYRGFQLVVEGKDGAGEPPRVSWRPVGVSQAVMA